MQKAQTITLPFSRISQRKSNPTTPTHPSSTAQPSPITMTVTIAQPASTSATSSSSYEAPAHPSPLHLASPPTLTVVGCPFSGGQRKGGVDTGPHQLIQSGLVEQIRQLGWNVEFEGHQRFQEIQEKWSGNDADIGIMKNPRTVSSVAQAVSDKIYSIASSGRMPLTLGGDHSLGLGTVSGTLRAHPDTALIWVDAHADINTPLTTESGNLHGCPVSFLLGLHGTHVEPFNSWVPGLTSNKDASTPSEPLLRPDSIVYIGLRDIDAGERKILKEHKIKAYSMHHVDKFGIGRVVEMALDYLNGDTSKRTRKIHLSFDVDALDPSVAPSTGTPVRGGLTFREGHYICEALAETGCLVAMDLMEVNPSLLEQRDQEATVKVGCSLIRSALGETLL